MTIQIQPPIITDGQLTELSQVLCVRSGLASQLIAMLRQTRKMTCEGCSPEESIAVQRLSGQLDRWLSQELYCSLLQLQVLDEDNCLIESAKT